MGASILSIGVTGLNVAQANLATTGQNITNANTPGYTRQQVVQYANEPMYTGSGFFGQGVNVETVKRVYNEHLNTQLLTAQSGAAEMASYQQQIDKIASLVADANAGMGPVMSAFFASLSELAANPSSTPSRQAFLSDAQTLVARFHSLTDRLDQINHEINTQISSEVSVINNYAQQIADINDRILLAQASGQGQPANDLHDQRDLLVAELNQKIRLTVLPQDDGSLNLFIGSGQPLLVGNILSPLVAVPDGFDQARTTVAMQLPGGARMPMPDDLLQGGSLGGLIAFRNATLDNVQNSLGRTAIALGQAFNDQHNLGQDLYGELGQDFFTLPQPTVMSHPDNPLPTVNVTARIDDIGELLPSDYLLSSDGYGNYTLRRLADDAVLVNNSPLPDSIDGLSIKLSADAPAGASFLIKPTSAGARDIQVAISDTRRIALAASVRGDADLQNAGTARISAIRVDNPTATPPSEPFTLRYLDSGHLDGFPVGSLVDNGNGALIPITSPTTKVPYTPGDTLSFSGLEFSLAAAPNHGDAFTITPQANGTFAAAVTSNTGLTDLFGTPATSTVQGAARGSSPLAFPLSIEGGVNDLFELTLDGGTASTITLAEGDYINKDALIAALQSAIDGATSPGAATVSMDAGNHLLITSNTQGSPTSVQLSVFAGNNGLADLFGAAPTADPRAVQQGGAALNNPITIRAGLNDRFSIALDGAGAQTILLPAGSYTPAELAAQLQTSINETLGGGSPAVTVTLDASNKLSVMSNVLGGSSSVALTAASSAASNPAVTAAADPHSSLPSAPITLTYDQASTTLSGFPVGASVVVSGAPGSPFAIDSPLAQVPYVAGASYSFNGMTLSFDGKPADGDRFTLEANTDGVADNRNALLLGQLQSEKILNGGSTSLQGSYAEMVNQIGNKAREVRVNGVAQRSLVEQAQKARESVSGVNLDEEAANLLRFQQAYQAAARLIAVADKLFDALLAL